MGTPVSIDEAKTHLSRLVTRAEHGEEIILTRSGRPVARLLALEPRGAVRTPGALRGQIEVPEGAGDLTDEELEDWYGR